MIPGGSVRPSILAGTNRTRLAPGGGTWSRVSFQQLSEAGSSPLENCRTVELVTGAAVFGTWVGSGCAGAGFNASSVVGIVSRFFLDEGCFFVAV